MVTSGYQFMNWQFVHLSKKHANRTPTFGPQFWHTENTVEGSSSIPLGLAKETISVLWNFCNHPEKGGQMSQKQSASPCTHILVIFILKWEKKTSSHLEIILFIYIYVRKKNRKKL